jgi:secreted trypsin-like serine protease
MCSILNKLHIFLLFSGPLLCKDSTKPNEPWTIYGITSFGDGCGKKNKFGIYAKLANYVDWIWSVVNCDGDCRT